MKIAFVHEYLNQFGGAERMLQVLCALYPRAPIYTLLYDREATGGVFDGRVIKTSFLQNLPFTKKHHRIFPLLMPLAIEQFDFSDYDFRAGRLVSYKRFDLAVRAFNENGLPLKIVGIGSELNKLKKNAGKNIEFLGLVSDEKLAKLYSNAQACIFPQEEDFGLVPLESMASGSAVIAYRAGGVAETVAENETGIFFNEQNPESLQAAIEKFHDLD